jgi:hypothetical protein
MVRFLLPSAQIVAPLRNVGMVPGHELSETSRVLIEGNAALNRHEEEAHECPGRGEK